MNKTWKYVIIGILIIMIVLVVIIVPPIARVITAKSKVKEEIAIIKARGEPVTMADLAGKKIPDNENAALVYAKAFKIISSPTSKKDFCVLSEFLKPEKRGKNPELWNQAQNIVNRYSPVFPIVGKAVTMRKCQFPVKWEKGMNTQFPHYQHLRNLMLLESAQAILSAKSSRMSEAVKSIETGFGISESLKDDPSMLVGALVRIGCIRTTCYALKEIISCSSVSEYQARHLSDIIATTNVSGLLLKAFKNERAQAIWMFDELRTNRHGMLSSFSRSSTPYRDNPGMSLWLDNDELYYLRTMKKQIAIANRPYHVQKLHPIKGIEESDIPRYAFVSEILLPVYSRTSSARDNVVAELAENQVALGLQIYHYRFGSFPSTLTELHSKLNWRTPQDPFSGKDLIYKPHTQGFLLYSVGLNLKDDGGIEDKKNPNKDDIVWKSNY